MTKNSSHPLLWVGGLSIIAAVFLLWISRYVWLPDVLLREEITIADVHTPDGVTLRVTQRFGSEMYLTMLEVIMNDGSRRFHVVDPDGTKIWSVVTSIDSPNSVFELRVGRDYYLKYDYLNDVLERYIDGRPIYPNSAAKPTK